MEAKDLMYNDLFMLNNKVKKIDTYSDMFETGKLEHIPLTTEILELNGFALESNSTYMKEGVRLVWWDCNEFYMNYYCLGEKEFPVRISKLVKYVHELQHALRLCGLVDLADNFKVE